MSDKPGQGDKRKSGPGGSVQKHKFYKFQGQNKTGRGGRGGGGGRGRGGGRGGHSGGDRPPRGDEDGSGKPKLNPLGKYRIKPMPEMFSVPGICVTTVMNKERAAEAELIEYLEQIADELYPETGDSEIKTEEDVDDLDFEAALKKDLESMDQENKSKRFQLCYHDVICVIYINVLPPLSPYKLVRHIMEQAESSARTQLKWCKRIIPITGISGATVKQLSEMASEVVQEGFVTEEDRGLKFAIDTNTRQSDRLERMDMIITVAEQVTKLDNRHSVDLKNPDKTILIELYKNTLGMTIVEDYERFKKYNPGSIAFASAQAKSKAKLEDQKQDQNDISESSQTINTSTEQLTKTDESPNSISKKTPKHVYRDRRAEGIASQSSTPSKSSALQNDTEKIGEGQQGESIEGKEINAEAGEILENPSEPLGEEWEEKIIDGKVERVRKDGN